MTVDVPSWSAEVARALPHRHPQRLRARAAAHPDPAAVEALHDLVVRTRLATW